MLFVHAICEPYTQDIPYAGWRDPLRQGLGLSWEDDDETVVTTLRTVLERLAARLLPWLPLLAIAFGAEVPTTREVRELSAEFRGRKLHEAVLRFLARLGIPTLVVIEHVHLMDEASAALLRAVAEALERLGLAGADHPPRCRGRLRPAGAGDGSGSSSGRSAREDALALAESTPEAHVLPPHLLELAVERSGGSPEFLLDLLAAAAGGSGTLPDSVEAAAGARIDALDPGDRALVRRAAVLGLAFHVGRLKEVLEPGTPSSTKRSGSGCRACSSASPTATCASTAPALCEVAYEGLPFSLRRELHSKVVARLARARHGRDVDADPAVLSLHFSRAGDHARAWKYALVGAAACRRPVRPRGRVARSIGARSKRARPTARRRPSSRAAWERLG